MYTYKIWNKTDDINGVDSNVVLKNNPIYKKGDVVLIINTDSDRVEFIAIESELRESYKDKVSNIEKLAEIRCEYYNNNAPMTVIELQNKISILEAENEKLKVEQEQQNEEILVNMLANTEMFEIILGMMPMALSIEDKNTKNNGGSNMVEVYVTLIIKGVKTIEDVPLVIREQVIERLKQLEVPVK